MSNEKQFIDFRKEVEKLKEIDGAEEYVKQLAHLFLGNGLSLQTILLMAIDFGQQHPHWIPVEEELPTGQPDENGRTSNYLCFCTGGAYRIANFADGLWWDCDEDTDNEDSVEWYVVYDVTHWMPLPVSPRKED